MSRETLLLLQRYCDQQFCLLCSRLAQRLNPQLWDHTVALAAVRDLALAAPSSPSELDTFSDDNAEAIALLNEQERQAADDIAALDASRAWLASHPEFDDSD